MKYCIYNSNLQCGLLT